MNDTLDPDRPAPHRNRARIALAAGAVVLLVAGAAAGGYRVGKAEAGGVPGKPSQCADSERALVDLEEEKAATTDDEETATIIRMQANVIVQNGDCFPADARAGAQLALDRQDEEAAAKALCYASDRPSWEC
ncbi:hypothetical protein G6W57_00610 [Streptomyces sp. CAI-121]|uniref:hypothetical protein n=1 Tax=unclassified Streptomyces TaxID=2593676 RepID=UPI0015870CE8|nr:MULTISPECIES: hypothetical protein [unclassified Streptomyces]NUV65617.1 hypothetical protein [Streptomyces sp. CAI-121]NUW12354.1 hypothetical protein [Streptomyces sp. CAI-68]